VTVFHTFATAGSADLVCYSTTGQPAKADEARISAIQLQSIG
jgi:hypothetical protein